MPLYPLGLTIMSTQNASGDCVAIRKPHSFGLPNWWLTYPSEKYNCSQMDDEIPNIWENKIHVPNHQPVVIE